jgi:hypothetical protein
MAVLTMRATIDISAYWPTDAGGEPVSVNSIYESLRGTENELGRNTLRLALDGRLDRGHYGNLVKLARLVSGWAGRVVTADELMTEEGDLDD